MAKIKSISVSIWDKDSKESTKAFLDLNLTSASALGRGSKFGSVAIKDIETEQVKIGDNTVTKVVGFKFADKEDSSAILNLEKIKFEFLQRDGTTTYDMSKTIFKENGGELKAGTAKLLSDISTVARAGFLGNEGKTHTDADFYKGELNVFQGTYFTDAENKIVNDGTDGATKKRNIEKIDPRDVEVAQTFLDARKPVSPEVEAPEVGEIER